MSHSSQAVQATRCDTRATGNSHILERPSVDVEDLMCIYQPHPPRSESVSLLCCLEFGTKGNDEDMLKN